MMQQFAKGGGCPGCRGCPGCPGRAASAASRRRSRRRARAAGSPATRPRPPSRPPRRRRRPSRRRRQPVRQPRRRGRGRLREGRGRARPAQGLLEVPEVTSSGPGWASAASPSSSGRALAVPLPVATSRAAAVTGRPTGARADRFGTAISSGRVRVARGRPRRPGGATSGRRSRPLLAGPERPSDHLARSRRRRARAPAGSVVSWCATSTPASSRSLQPGLPEEVAFVWEVDAARRRAGRRPGGAGRRPHRDRVAGERRHRLAVPARRRGGRW